MNDKKSKSTHHDDSIFEKVIGDGFKGRFKQMMGDFKLPKEALNYIFKQIDETKDAAVGIIAKEVRLLLEKTDIAEEMAKVLTKVSFEVTTNIRFKRVEDDADKGLKIKISTLKNDSKKSEEEDKHTNEKENIKEDAKENEITEKEVETDSKEIEQ